MQIIQEISRAWSLLQNVVAGSRGTELKTLDKLHFQFVKMEKIQDRQRTKMQGESLLSSIQIFYFRMRSLPSVSS